MKRRRWKYFRKCEILSINSTGWKDGWRDKMMRKWGRRGTNSSVFLFNPLFVIIPLGKSSLFRKEERGGGGRPEGIK